MEKMLNEYLQFTKSSFQEKDEMFNLTDLLSEITKNMIIKIYQQF